MKGIDFCYLTEVDVVRHEMVKRIIRAYDEFYDSGSRNRHRAPVQHAESEMQPNDDIFADDAGRDE